MSLKLMSQYQNTILTNKTIKDLHNRDWLTPTKDLRENKKKWDVYKLFTVNIIRKHQAENMPIKYFKARNEIHNKITRNK